MEYQHLFSILNSIFIILLVILLIWRNKSRTKTNTSKLPPGPWKLPIIGNLHQMVGSMPHVKLTQLAKKYGPIMHLQLGEVANIMISSREIAKEILTTHDLNFADRPLSLAASIFFYGPSNVGFRRCDEYWRKVRKICVVEIFSSKSVQSSKPIREKEVWNLITRIESNIGSPPIDLSKMVMTLTSSVAQRIAFGDLYCKEEVSIIPLLNKVMEILGGFSLTDFFPSNKLLFTLTGRKGTIMKLHNEIDKILHIIINQHRATRNSSLRSHSKNHTVGLLDVLLTLQNQGNSELSLTENNIKALIVDMFFAGSETASTIIIWAMSELIRNPYIMKKVQTEVREVYKGEESIDETKLQELNYLKLVIKETMRFHSPGAVLIPRQCREDVEIHGYKIPSKSVLHINILALAKDPKYWKEPERFDPERFIDSPIDYKGASFEFLLFGAGRRICPGMQLGMAVVELTLANLLYHFDWKLPNGMKHEDLDMSEAFGLTIKRKYPLYLTPAKYVN